MTAVGGLQGEVGAVPAHGNTQVGGGIVHAVTDEQHAASVQRRPPSLLPPGVVSVPALPR